MSSRGNTSCSLLWYIQAMLLEAIIMHTSSKISDILVEILFVL